VVILGANIDMVAERLLILFGRYPAAGRVKTRLVPRLGALGAAELHRRLSERTLDAMLASRLAPVCFCYSGASPARMRGWLAHRPVDLQPQSAGDLGRRMQQALEHALKQGARQALLVGTDIPGLSTRILQRAFEALSDHDVVLGPSLDGGYYLVGMRRRAPIFDRIPWGTGQVLTATLDAARRRGFTTALLEPLADVDRPADLALLPPEWLAGPYLSIVIPAFNESAAIGDTLAQFASGSTDLEVIVVDGGSIDDTAARARQTGARVIVTPSGRARQQNAGAAIAGGRALLFLHADTHLPTDFHAQIFEALLDPRVVLGAFRFKTDYDHRGMRLVEAMVGLRVALLRMPYGDQAIFMPKSAFERVGGFPDAVIAEDLFLVRKLLKTGRLALAPGHALTSGRRWRALGLLRTTLINYVIAAGCLMGVPPSRLAPLYKRGLRRSASNR
jgi:uncharacterized protein